MRLNFLAYSYLTVDGYGRYSARLVQALERAGVQVTPHFAGSAVAPAWLQARWGMDFGIPTVSCLPPYYLQRTPPGSAPHWLLTMTEGSEAPDKWPGIINKAGISRLIVPCQHNAEAFARGGVECPISVIHGGTDPAEFALLPSRLGERPYTFLALADRGNRKGWQEVWAAFYRAFGSRDSGERDVRLIIKTRPYTNKLVDMIRSAEGLDRRIRFITEDYDDMRDLYALADCFAIPSQGEGWGMPHREAAMCGLPVITQRHSGLDDGHTEKWALVVERGTDVRIPAGAPHIKGVSRRADVEELADKMRWCYDRRDEAASFGQNAATWLRANQTWDDSAANLLELMARERFLLPEMEFA